VKTPYDILGVTKTASQDELKKAYRKLAREFHPDRNPGDAAAEERFKEIQSAYDTVGDEEKRKKYDAGGNGFQGFGPGGFNPADVNLGDFGDLLGGLFGGRRAPSQPRQRPQRGADLEVPVKLSFEDALRGIETKVAVEVDATCRTCHGSGAEPGTAPTLCPVCHGRGVLAESQGLFAISQPCPRCRGNGTIIETPCHTCRGTGVERRTRRYTVKIPAGVKTGTRIRLKGKGAPGEAGGPPGDLYVVTEVEPSKRFHRRGKDLVVDVPVTYPEAALGATVEVPTPDGGRVSLKVPPGAHDGKLLRLRGQGAPKLKGDGNEDLLARVKVAVPAKLTKKEREALEALQKASHDDPREELFD
jgi:molecular chaperone DnaJ